VLKTIDLKMSPNNFERLVRLAEEVFSVKNDPSQLNVDNEIIKRLQRIHPCTVSEYDVGQGPVAWVLVIPSKSELMHRFINGNISEKELFDLTPVDAEYEALYLCSALVLEEYRRKGITKRLVQEAINNIRIMHPIKALFVWPFTNEGDLAAEKISKLTQLPLYKRKTAKEYH
jgi:GNAT superfamily N-acetyltransferase